MVYKASIWISSTVNSWHLNLERHLESFKWIYFECVFWMYIKPTKFGETKFSSILQFEKPLCHICKLFDILLNFNRQNLLNSFIEFIRGKCRPREKKIWCAAKVLMYTFCRLFEMTCENTITITLLTLRTYVLEKQIWTHKYLWHDINALN